MDIKFSLQLQFFAIQHPNFKGKGNFQKVHFSVLDIKTYFHWMNMIAVVVL